MNILNIAAYRFVRLAHFCGECFVFDQRVALDAALHETGAAGGAA